jgi:hypothetical protein
MLKTITRRQLCELGTTQYQARSITSGLEVIGKYRSTYVYALWQVHQAILERLNQPRLHKGTKRTLRSLLDSIDLMFSTVKDLPMKTQFNEISYRRVEKELVNSIRKLAADLGYNQ